MKVHRRYPWVRLHVWGRRYGVMIGGPRSELWLAVRIGKGPGWVWTWDR